MEECEKFCLDSTQYFEKYLPSHVNSTGKLGCSWKSHGDVFFNTTACYATQTGECYGNSGDQDYADELNYKKQYYFEYNLGDFSTSPHYNPENYSYQKDTIDNLVYIIINANTFRQFEQSLWYNPVALIKWFPVDGSWGVE